MLSRTIARRAALSSRALHTSRVLATEGATGAAKDQFSEREKAQENVYIKKHEAEQLKKLREKLNQQKETIDNLEKEINNLKK